MRFHTPRFGSGSETESEAGDLLDQQFEELNHKLSSAADPTGYLRMVSRNNLFNRSGFALGPEPVGLRVHVAGTCKKKQNSVSSSHEYGAYQRWSFTLLIITEGAADLPWIRVSLVVMRASVPRAGAVRA